MLHIRWENPNGLTGTAPTADDWTSGTPILGCLSSCSPLFFSETLTSTSYEASIGYFNPASGSQSLLDFTWLGWNMSGGDGSLYLDPGLKDALPPAVPIPPALWLFGSGLLAVAGIGRSRRRGEKGGAKTHPVAGGAP